MSSRTWAKVSSSAGGRDFCTRSTHRRTTGWIGQSSGKPSGAMTLDMSVSNGGAGIREMAALDRSPFRAGLLT